MAMKFAMAASAMNPAYIHAMMAAMNPACIHAMMESDVIIMANIHNITIYRSMDNIINMTYQVPKEMIEFMDT